MDRRGTCLKVARRFDELNSGLADGRTDSATRKIRKSEEEGGEEDNPCVMFALGKNLRELFTGHG